MRVRTDSDTWHLSTGSVAITSDRKSRIMLRVVLAAVLVLLAVLAGLRLFAEAAGPAARLAALEQQNSTLGAEIARLRAELELERATRAALEQQVVDLNTQASDLASQLNFFNAQSGRARAGRSRN